MFLYYLFIFCKLVVVILKELLDFAPVRGIDTFIEFISRKVLENCFDIFISPSLCIILPKFPENPLKTLRFFFLNVRLLCVSKYKGFKLIGFLLKFFKSPLPVWFFICFWIFLRFSWPENSRKSIDSQFRPPKRLFPLENLYFPVMNLFLSFRLSVSCSLKELFLIICSCSL